MTIILIGLVVAVILIWFMIFKPNEDAVGKGLTRLEPGTKLTNRKGKYYNVDNMGMLEDYFFKEPEVKRQLDGFQHIYMRETILALWQGKRPPNQVGGYGILTKKKLIIEWNDKWQREMNKLEESYDINYKILFDIPEEYPEAGIVYTADEIVKQYGREKESS